MWMVVASLLMTQVELKNDSWSSGQQAAFQGGFALEEVAAVRLDPGGPAEIQTIEFLFGGLAGAPSTTVAIALWDDRALTTDPGPLVFTEGYLLTPVDDVLQQIDLTGRGVTVEGTFRLGLQFFHDGFPSVARDDDGNIDGSKNFIRLANGTWLSAETAGVSGDWIIRSTAVITAAPDAGAPDSGGQVDAGPPPDSGVSVDAAMADAGGGDANTAPTPAPEEEGCGCGAVSDAGEGPGALLLSFALLLFRRRRGAP